MPSTSAKIDAYSCRGRMGDNTNVEGIKQVHKVEEEQRGEDILGMRITSCRKKKERKEREETDLIESDQLFGVVEHLPHCTVTVCILVSPSRL